MIAVNNNIIEDCKKDKLTYREYIIIDNKTIDIKGELDATAYKDTTFFGTFNMKMLKFETENDVEYKGKEFEYYKEVNGNSFKIGNFITTDVSDNDTKETVKVTAYDYALKFANEYKTSLNYKSGKITLFQVLQEVCYNCNITLNNTNVPNGSFIVDSDQFVNGETYGDVISHIALINGMFATINSNDELELIFTKETDEIIEDYVELEDKRDTQPITSVLIAQSEDLAEAGAVRKDQTLISQYGEHWLKIYDYAFAYSTEKANELVDAVFNQVKGFGYSSFKSEYSFKPYMELGDKVQFRNKDGELVNSIVLRYNTKYDDITLEAPSIINASVEYDQPESDSSKILRVNLKVDQQSGVIESVVNDTTNLQNPNSIASQFSVVKQTLGDLESKIGDIADVTITQESDKAKAELNDINESEPIHIRIYPISQNISYLYPNNNIFPNDKLFNKIRILRFINTRTNQVLKDYELPDDLLYYDEDTFDEFILDYETQTCRIVKRCEYNENGEVIKLSETKIHDYEEYPKIELTDGDYKIELIGYDNGYLSVRLMASNIYTSQFTTKVELASTIKQTKKSIETEVSENYTTKEETNTINTKIKQTARSISLTATDNGTSCGINIKLKNEDGTEIDSKSANITLSGTVKFVDLKNSGATEINGANIITGSISANKLDVAGVITSINNNTTTTINGSKITTGTITASQIKSSTITGDKIAANTITASKCSSDIITTNNLSAQVISCNQLSGGSISGQSISGSSISGGSISGSTISGGSISISKSGYYFNMGVSTSHPNCSGLNVGSGGIHFSSHNVGLNSSKGTITAGATFVASNFSQNGSSDNVFNGTTYIYGNLKTNFITPGGRLVLTTGGRTGYGTHASSMYLYAGANITLNAASGNYVYVGNANVGNARAATDSSGPSSKILKENITEFKNNEYEEALSLLSDMKLYDYNYKYNIHPKKDQFGFIIDDLLEDERAKKFFYFKDEIAGVNENNYLDYSIEDNDDQKIKKVKFKRYDEETLIKYLLVCIKGLQEKIKKMEDK